MILYRNNITATLALSLWLGSLSTLALWSPVADADNASCPQISVPDADFRPSVRTLNLDKIELSADSAELSEGGLSELLGSVKLRQGNRYFSADALDFDESSQTIRVDQESLFRDERLIVKSSQAKFSLAEESGEFSDIDYTLIDRGARGSANRLMVNANGLAELDSVKYTNCGPGDEDWILEASSIQLNTEEGFGTARNARLRFFGVPILYLPYFRFPIDNQRRTGFLFPTVGQSSDNGLDFGWPVYFNIAPNVDAIVTPRYLSKRGLLGKATGRYLLPDNYGEGFGQAEVLDDRIFGETRSYFQLGHQGLVNERLALDANYAEVSDERYFEDLGGDIESSAITHLERHARFNYRRPGYYSATFLVQDFQVLDPSVPETSQPYRRLPQILFRTRTRDDWQGLRASLNAEYVNFVSQSKDIDEIEGQRISVVPNIRWVKDENSWFARTQLDLDHTQYILQNTGTLDSEPDRTLPIFSAEAGLRFERINDSGWLQTLEPRAFYLYSGYKDQTDLPIFDSGEPDFDIVQLFARNRFSGKDRISDANLVAGALTTRLLDPNTGLTKLSATVGQISRIKDERVALPGDAAPDSGATDFISAIDYRHTDKLSANAAVQYSPETNDLSRVSTALHWNNNAQRVILGYRYRRDLLEQADLTFATPLGGRWQGIGRWRYSLNSDTDLDMLFGLEYDTCCWTARTTWRKYISNVRGETDTGVYFQLELKGLGGIGSNFRRVLFPDQ